MPGSSLSRIKSMADACKEKGLVPDFEATLDAHFEAMVSDESFKVPGVVVLARRGKDTYLLCGLAISRLGAA